MLKDLKNPCISRKIVFSCIYQQNTGLKFYTVYEWLVRAPSSANTRSYAHANKGNVQQNFGSVMAGFSIEYLLRCPATYEVQIWMANYISNSRDEKETYSNNNHGTFVFHQGSLLDSWKVKGKLKNSFHTSEVYLG